MFQETQRSDAPEHPDAAAFRETLQSLEDQAESSPTSLHQTARDRLKAFVERIERLEEEKAAITNDIKEVYAEAKGNGFDTKIMKEIIKRRAMAEHERLERDALLATYEHALGMAAQPNLPL